MKPKSGPFWVRLRSGAVPLAAAGALLSACEQGRSQLGTEAQALSASPEREAPAKARAPEVVLDIAATYPDPQPIGDKRGVSLMQAPPGIAHSPPDAWAIEYIREKKGIGRAGLGGICWQNRPGNTGDKPGDDLKAKGFRRLSFWAKGAKGGEVAEFRAGGLGNIKTRYQDSFDVTVGSVRLKPEWAEYRMFLNDADLSSVITPFCVLIQVEQNPEGALVFVDDMQFER